jgi:hypothetical protein
MLAASSRLRIAAALVASTLTTLVVSTSPAQTIDLSLNVFYTNPANTALGGTWELVAKSTPSPATFGISGISARLSNIDSNAVLQAPRATVNGSNIAGFQLLANTFDAATPTTPAFRELTIGQLPIFPLPAGSEQSYFYGVGTVTNGSPEYAGKPAGSNSIGPTFTSLTSPQHIPWATADAFNDATWATAARLVSGSFGAGVTPAFITGSTGNVFTSLPLTNTALGNEAAASAITTIVRTNAAAVVNSADYNVNGLVDAPDYVLWRKTLNGTATPAGSGADGNHDGTVNPADYTLWQSHFGNPMGAGSGGGLSTGSIPEPTSCILLTIGLLLISASRRGRFQQQLNK